MLANALNSASPLVKRKLENNYIKENHGGSGRSKRYCKRDATAFPIIPKSTPSEILL